MVKVKNKVLLNDTLGIESLKGIDLDSQYFTVAYEMNANKASIVDVQIEGESLDMTVEEFSIIETHFNENYYDDVFEKMTVKERDLQMREEAAMDLQGEQEYDFVMRNERS